MKKVGLVSLILTIVFALTLSASAQSHNLKKIFILHSYEVGHVCGQPQHDGVLSVLKENGYIIGDNLEIDVFAMDTKRKHNTPKKIANQSSIALKRIRKFKPDVLVTLDDNAFRTVGLKLVDTGLPIVFSGMNGQPEDYNQTATWLNSRKRPGHNISGVYEKIHFVNAVRVQQKILPALTKIRMITDTSPTGRALSRQVNLEMAGKDLGIEFDLKVAQSWEDYQRIIMESNRDSKLGTLYPVALLLRDEKGKTYTAPEIFHWTVENSRKPALALNFAFVQLGLFGGASVDFRAMGRQAGAMVLQALKGSSPGELPVEDAKRYALVFNLKRAKKLNINIPQDILLAADEIYGLK